MDPPPQLCVVYLLLAFHVLFLAPYCFSHTGYPSSDGLGGLAPNRGNGFDGPPSILQRMVIRQLKEAILSCSH